MTNQSDTVHGYLNSQKGRRNFEVCKFRTTFKGNVITYQPGEIRSFKFVAGKRLVSEQVNLSDEEPGWRFLEQLTEGTLSLYRYKSRFLIKAPDGSINELVIEMQTVMVDDQQTLRPLKKYIGTLTYLMRDCQDLSGQIKQVKFNEADLISIVETYNRCKDKKDLAAPVKRKGFSVKPGIMAGMTSSVMMYKVEDLYFPNHFGPITTFSGGVDVEVGAPGLEDFLTFYTGLFYTKNHYNMYAERQQPPATTIYDDITARFVQLRIPLMIRYVVNTGGFKPYVNLGFDIVLMVDDSDHWIQEVEANDVIYTYMRSPLEFRKYAAGLTGGIGIKKEIGRSLETKLEVRYEKNRGFDVSGQRSESKLENIQLLFGISL